MHAFTHVTVIDATGAPARPDQTVVVRDGRIAVVGPYAEVPIPEEALVSDLTGKFVIPGLADMHIHGDADERIHPPLYIANGITTVREMWGKPYLHEWRDRISAGEMLGPRWIIASNLVDGSPSLWSDIPETDPPISVSTEAETRQAVRDAKDEGADFVKVYSRVPRELYAALMDEASRRDIPVAGHLPDAVPMSEAIEFGQRSFEHVHALWPATSREEAALQQAMARISPEPGMYYSSWFRQINEVEWQAANTYSVFKAAAVFERMVANEVAYCPTLVMHELLDIPDRANVLDERLTYMPSYFPEICRMTLDDLYTDRRSAEEAAQRRLLFQRRLETVAAMSEAGVRILAGTDTMTAFAFPGFSLHDELAMLVRAGLTPMRALQTATLEPARFLGLDSEQGTIESGKVADLVLLDANPLEDIRNTTLIHAIVVGGRFIDAEERQELLDSVAKAAQS